jgi:hypothetical protein
MDPGMRTCPKCDLQVEDDKLFKCPRCSSFLPGTGGGHSGNLPHEKHAEKKAREWAKESGIDFDSMEAFDRDILIRASGRNASSTDIDRAALVLGKYRVKPKGNEQQAETITAEITAETVEQLEKSLKTLRRLANERKNQEG